MFQSTKNLFTKVINPISQQTLEVIDEVDEFFQPVVQKIPLVNSIDDNLDKQREQAMDKLAKFDEMINSITQEQVIRIFIMSNKQLFDNHFEEISKMDQSQVSKYLAESFTTFLMNLSDANIKSNKEILAFIQESLPVAASIAGFASTTVGTGIGTGVAVAVGATAASGGAIGAAVGVGIVGIPVVVVTLTAFNITFITYITSMLTKANQEVVQKIAEVVINQLFYGKNLNALVYQEYLKMRQEIDLLEQQIKANDQDLIIQQQIDTVNQSNKQALQSLAQQIKPINNKINNSLSLLVSHQAKLKPLLSNMYDVSSQGQLIEQELLYFKQELNIIFDSIQGHYDQTISAQKQLENINTLNNESYTNSINGEVYKQYNPDVHEQITNINSQLTDMLVDIDLLKQTQEWLLIQFNYMQELTLFIKFVNHKETQINYLINEIKSSYFNGYKLNELKTLIHSQYTPTKPEYDFPQFQSYNQSIIDNYSPQLKEIQYQVSQQQYYLVIFLLLVILITALIIRKYYTINQQINDNQKS